MKNLEPHCIDGVWNSQWLAISNMIPDVKGLIEHYASQYEGAIAFSRYYDG